MKKTPISEAQLQNILKENALEKASDDLSLKLYAIAVASQKPLMRESTVDKWLGKFTIGVLVVLNIVVFLYLSSFSFQQVFFVSMVAFIVGLWSLIALFMKNQNAMRDIRE